MLKLENVSKFYYNKGIIASGFTKANLELKIGEFVVITGESGSGKSTLLNVISGLDSYEEGEMYINGKETSHYTEKDFEEYRRKYIANIFQSFNLVNSYTVYQNVELVLLLNGYKKRHVKKKILDIIDQVGLTKFKNTKVSKLSGGQKQRVAIARAMVKDTPIIVADEPTGNLDSKSAKDVIEILKKVAKDKLVVVVTHNIEQIEEQATRIIKMHDGRIVENRQIKKITKEPEAKESEYNKITLLNKYRLGIRNTFNIIPKFLLLFAVFFFMSTALLSEYAGFQLSEYEAEKVGHSMMFSDLSENRILIKKADKTAFAMEDYENVKKLDNIDYIVEDDLLLDANINLNKDDMDFYGSVISIENFKGKIDIGRMPEKDDEAILEIAKDHYFIEYRLDDILEKTFSIASDERIGEGKNVVIVGIKYSEDDNYNGKFYVSNSVLKDLRALINRRYSSEKIFFNEQYINEMYYILPSDTVERGTVVVLDEMRYQFSNSVIRNRPIKIEISNIYYNDELNLVIGNTFTKNNFKNRTGYDKYEYYMNAIFINEDDYKSLYDKPSYQSSVYIKDMKQISKTMQELENIGLKPKKVTDYKYDEGAIFKQVIKIIKVIVTIVLIIVLFFISYLIVKIILKSRNVYYTTLRMLGATYKSVRKILDIELFINSSLAYLSILTLIYLVKINIIKFEYVSKLSEYLNLREYILMYIILASMSILISRRFSKKLFKKSTISTYNEEV